MELVEMRLPVFLPGNNRDWTRVQGLATITDEGEIKIVLKSKEDALTLVKMAKDGILMQVAFDYLMSIEMANSIDAQARNRK